MTIDYLIQVKENPVINGFKNEPMSIADIIKLESKYNKGNEFPKAFREFLFLAGEFNNFAFDLIDDMEQLQEYMKEDLEAAGQNITESLIAFDVLDSVYSVILLSETNPDPKVYLVMPFLAKRGLEPIIKSNGWNFTALINESIRRIKNNIPF